MIQNFLSIRALVIDKFLENKKITFVHFQANDFAINSSRVLGIYPELLLTKKWNLVFLRVRILITGKQNDWIKTAFFDSQAHNGSRGVPTTAPLTTTPHSLAHQWKIAGLGKFLSKILPFDEISLEKPYFSLLSALATLLNRSSH